MVSKTDVVPGLCKRALSLTRWDKEIVSSEEAVLGNMCSGVAVSPHPWGIEGWLSRVSAHEAEVKDDE